MIDPDLNCPRMTHHVSNRYRSFMVLFGICSCHVTTSYFITFYHQIIALYKDETNQDQRKSPFHKYTSIQVFEKLHTKYKFMKFMSKNPCLLFIKALPVYIVSVILPWMSKTNPQKLFHSKLIEYVPIKHSFI